MMLIRGRGISGGKGVGRLLLSSAPISFLSGVDPHTGLIIEKGHPLCGRSLSGRVLAFPYGKGSTVGSYVLYALSKNGHAPVALIAEEAEPIIATGAIMAQIPLIDRLSSPLSTLRDETLVSVDGDLGVIEIHDSEDLTPPLR